MFPQMKTRGAAPPDGPVSTVQRAGCKPVATTSALGVLVHLGQ